MENNTKTNFVTPMEVSGNRCYLNSDVWVQGKKDNSPLGCYVRWSVPTKDPNSERKSDLNSIKVIFFSRERDSHPLKSAKKGDIISFPSGRLQLSTHKGSQNNAQGRPEEILDYAEIVVFDNLNVEHVDNQGAASVGQRTQASAPAQNAAPAGQAPAQQQSTPAPAASNDEVPL